MEQQTPHFRIAKAADLAFIARLLADDRLGAFREEATDPLIPEHTNAYAAIEADPNNELIVAERGGLLVGVLQLTYIPNLKYKGTRS